MERAPLSPKKLRSSNILPASTGTSPASPTKKSHARHRSSPKRELLRARPTPGSPTKSRSSKYPSFSPTAMRSSDRQVNSSPVKLSPFKVFTEDAVYATNLESQIAANEQLVLSPPQVSSRSPSPRKQANTVRKTHSCLQPLHESARMPRTYPSDPFTLPRNAFLTPPRPRLSPALQVREEERLTKSASPILGRGRGLDHSPGFTIYVDSSEYFAVCNMAFSIGRDVNKENMWEPAVC